MSFRVCNPAMGLYTQSIIFNLQENLAVILKQNSLLFEGKNTSTNIKNDISINSFMDIFCFPFILKNIFEAVW